MHKTIGVFAHVDAGKTTFSESLLYYTNQLKEKGRVDHKTSFLDTHDIERERGITIFADQALFDYKDHTYYLIDTPGHVDFTPEMERSMMIMDYAIIIVSAVEGIQGHTETVWQLLKDHHIPTFIFINKIDRVGADVEAVADELKGEFSSEICLLKEDHLDLLYEYAAERDEALLDLYLVGNRTDPEWVRKITNLITNRNLIVCMSGSALKDQGIEPFFELIHKYSTTAYSSNDKTLAAKVYKIRYDEKGTRVTYLKLISGSIHVRDMLEYSANSEIYHEKITQIRLVNGRKSENVDGALAGQVVGIVGFSQTYSGLEIGSERHDTTSHIIPTLKSKVIYKADVNLKALVKAFNELNEEDPTLNVVWEEQHAELTIQVMGIIQLEVLKHLLKQRFGFDISFDKPSIIYKESIADTAIGKGHFEPLGHYAEVHLKLEKGQRGSGVQFLNACHADDMTTGNQNLVKHHLFEKAHRGLLTGSPLTDLKVTLLTGKAHKMHTSGGDFREATKRALRQGLEKADNLLLEPYYNFRIKVHLDHLGRVLSDIQKFSGTFSPPEIKTDKVIITGRAPVATLMEYPLELAAFTAGKGMIQLVVCGYDTCHNTHEVIKEKAYDKHTDSEYSSSSIFCSKGSGYTVDWEEAEALMHCES
ncbi:MULTISPECIES: translation factor GTPase family protein [unclassified Fusibacter]|uniref:elongation factor G n=1 Tax=unclassified Fusibacter TaxID=2624464 RepID=UPI00101024D3|nr:MULTISPECIES: TetM/TetW/TetO/TetS family tetracycline resistance ribosomal protection protein [unclassified Fusibacter]MCK8060302.1 TetM/TetW/TetO/TetS family tetracycline resistance ribosomal protection protein [Fusibacter sp. A2]NPE20409.1 TetM/TetW/TetO/TetS family tetracycline resistance ribosomal protection protein [Fusibacter sp. A1]RXV63614.1 GTP-binding protein [Fusibacter sp. A1]